MYCTDKVQPFNIKEFEGVIKQAKLMEGKVLVFLSKNYCELKFRQYESKSLKIVVNPERKICGLRAHFVFYEDLINQDWVKKVIPPMFNIVKNF